MTGPSTASDAAVRLALNGLLARQREAQRRDGAPSAALRIDRLNRCIALLVDHRDEIEAALNADFGARSRQATAFTDIASSIGPLKHARDHLAALDAAGAAAHHAAPSSRCSAPGRRSAASPRASSGIISPWNFPVNLTFAPLAGVLAAGNRAMIKPSEFTPVTSELLKEMFASVFDEEEIAVVTGGPEVGQAFSGLAFDHLIFTGATSIARHVMRAAAENLVPVTLELGGKSPVDHRPLRRPGHRGRADHERQDPQRRPDLPGARLCAGAGGPDGRLRRAGQGRGRPDVPDPPRQPRLHGDRGRPAPCAAQRATSTTPAPRARDIVEINPAGEDLRQQPHRRIAPTLILNPTDDMKVMQEEIFGPLLPVKTYQKRRRRHRLRQRPRPAAGALLLRHRHGRARPGAGRTTSGGVTVNDVVLHVAQEELPFGGIGPAGMGGYHGEDGFREFSHRKSVFHQMKWDIAPLRMLRPPFGAGIARYLATQIRR